MTKKIAGLKLYSEVMIMPTMEEYLKAAEGCTSYTQIGRELGVSKQAVQGFFRRHGIEFDGGANLDSCEVGMRKEALRNSKTIREAAGEIGVTTARAAQLARTYGVYPQIWGASGYYRDRREKIISSLGPWPVRFKELRTRLMGCGVCSSPGGASQWIHRQIHKYGSLVRVKRGLYDIPKN